MFDGKEKRLLAYIRVMHLIFIVSMIAIIVYILISINESSQIRENNGFDLQIGEIVMGCLCILFFLLGIFLMRFHKWKKSNRTEIEIIFLHLISICIFEGIAMCGFILARIGGLPYITLAFIILPLVALVLTYPTNKRVRSWQTNSN